MDLDVKIFLKKGNEQEFTVNSFHDLNLQLNLLNESYEFKKTKIHITDNVKCYKDIIMICHNFRNLIYSLSLVLNFDKKSLFLITITEMK